MLGELMSDCIAGGLASPSPSLNAQSLHTGGDFPRQTDITDRQEEMQAAAQIQQGLMAVTLPRLPFAVVSGMSLPCTEIGGDFFTALNVEHSVVIAIADVSGKGIAAAVMASALQGMMHEGLLYNVPVEKIAKDANDFFAARDLGAKYATCAILRVEPDGTLEYLNCGHIPPLVVRGRNVLALSESNLPIGLFQNVDFRSAKFQLLPEDRIVLVTDGVTDAEGAAGAFFGYDRLKLCVAQGASPDEIYSAVQLFCGDRPLSDDCTIMGLHYKGETR
jgi:serine phosphatase RsbU (regulator of sigma subunit)